MPEHVGGTRRDAPVVELPRPGVAQNQIELYALYQRTAGIAQAQGFSQAFFVIGLLCFAGAVLALFLRSGRPEGASAAMAH